jgi:hypothetical protein
MPDSEPNFLSTTSLISDELKRLFHISRAKQKVMILDCCYSGSVGESGFKGSLTDTLRSLAQQIEGTFLLTASASSKPAFESATAGGGALTSCFVEGIRSGAAAPPDADGITLGQLASYVRRKVPGLEAQQPQQWDLGGLGDLPLARKPRMLGDAWQQRAKRKLAAWLRTDRIDEELADDIRRAIRNRRDPRYASQVGLIERWVDQPMTGSFFVREWDRIGGASPGAPPLPDPSAEAPPAPSEPTEIQGLPAGDAGPPDEKPESPPRETGDDEPHRPEPAPDPEYAVRPPSGDRDNPWPKRVLIAVIALGLLIALWNASGIGSRSEEAGPTVNYAEDPLMDGTDMTPVDSLNGTVENSAAATDDALNSVGDGNGTSDMGNATGL